MELIKENKKLAKRVDELELYVKKQNKQTNYIEYLNQFKPKYTFYDFMENFNITEEQFVFGGAEKYPRLLLGNTNILEIISCTDSDGNTWKEVPFLAQDTVFDSVRNTAANNPELSQYNDEAPYLLKLLKTPRRFVTFIRGDGKTELRFGSGISDSADEEIIPNPNNVGSALPGSPSYLDTFFDPCNFLSTQAYGQAPANTTLTIKYSYGGGISDNVSSDTITNMKEFNYSLDTTTLDSGVVDLVTNSVGVTNEYPTSGAKGAESIQELKSNALAYFQSQGRAVTKEDYITWGLDFRYNPEIINKSVFFLLKSCIL